MRRGSTKIVAMKPERQGYVPAKLRRYNLWDFVIYECEIERMEPKMA